MKICSIYAALVSLLLAGHASAITIDADKFFAYASSPKLRQYVLLSHSQCADTAANMKGWRAAAFTNATMVGLMPACWINSSSKEYGQQIRFCLVSSKTQKMGNACQPISKDIFIDTSTLPSKARF